MLLHALSPTLIFSSQASVAKLRTGCYRLIVFWTLVWHPESHARWHLQRFVPCCWPIVNACDFDADIVGQVSLLSPWRPCAAVLTSATMREQILLAR